MNAAAVSNSEVSTRWPSPVRSRCRSAAIAANAAYIPVATSTGEAPTREGLRSGLPVFHISPDIACAMGSVAGRSL